MKKIDGKSVTLIIENTAINSIERIAQKRNMTKSEVYRMMIDLGVSLHNDMEKVGIVGLLDFAYYVKKTISEKNAELSKGKQLRII